MSHYKISILICCFLFCLGCTQVGLRPNPTVVAIVNPSSAAVASSDFSDSIHSQFSRDLDNCSAHVATVAYRDGQGTSEPIDRNHLAMVQQSDLVTLETVSVQEMEAQLEAFSDVDFVDATQGNGEIVYTLEELEQIALTNNPSIIAAGATVSKALGLRRQVGTRPNPTLGYFGQQLADQNTDQHGVFIEQEFVRGNKLALNQEVLGHTMSAQRWELQTQRLRVLTDVRVRFFEAIAAQRRADATTDFATVARRGVQVAVDRHKAEEGNLVEVLQAKTLHSEITLAAEQAEVEYRGAWNELAAVAGLSVSAPARLDQEFDAPRSSPDWDATYAEILAGSPELSVANALVCEKQALLKRQRVQMVPNVTAQFGAGYDHSTDSGMINLQFGAPIPVWNKNSGNISAAYADYTLALENVNRIEQAIKSRLARATQEFDSALAAVSKYEREIIPQTTKSLELSEEAYRAGELEFLQVLIVRRSYFESVIRLIVSQARLAQANAKVDGLLLTGGLDAPTDYTDGDGIRGASFSGQ